MSNSQIIPAEAMCPRCHEGTGMKYEGLFPGEKCPECRSILLKPEPTKRDFPEDFGNKGKDIFMNLFT